MEHLETQVSDLRSFLPVTLAAAPPPPMSSATAGARGGFGHSHASAPAASASASASASAPAPAPAASNRPTPRHPSSHRSPISAFGSNSALPSPTAATLTATSIHPHQSTARGFVFPAARAGPNVAASDGSVSSGAKRKPEDASPDFDGQQRQQRSKRNRVRLPCRGVD